MFALLYANYITCGTVHDNFFLLFKRTEVCLWPWEAQCNNICYTTLLLSQCALDQFHLLSTLQIALSRQKQKRTNLRRYHVSTDVFSSDRSGEGIRKAGFTLLNCVLSSLQSVFRGCERDH